MRFSIGMDAIEISRFTHWHLYKTNSLRRIFSAEEIEYCMSVPLKTAERFAVRFAAKEALYKALYQLAPLKIPFGSLARHAHINSKQGCPILCVNWQRLVLDPVTVHVTLTHTRTLAYAQVLLTSPSCSPTS